MKKYILIIATLVLAITAGCKEEKKAPSMSDQMKTVMAAHDEVMPKLGKMGRLVGELNSKEDSTKIGMKYRQARIDLQDANKSMMDWMQSFSNRFDSDEISKGKELSPTKKPWLNEEEENVKIVKEKINTSIANAEALLGH
jgi:hypothetical protein